MKHYLLLLALTFCSIQLRAQSISTLMGARANGMGYASAAMVDGWSMFNNIAGLAKTESVSAAFTYDVRSALPGANRTAAVFALPTKLGIAGAGLFRFGDDLYSETMISAGFSNQLGLTSLGLKVNYIQYRAEGFGSKGVVTLSFGGIAEITPMLSVGAYITNINQPKISQDEDRVPTLLTAGIAFTPTDKLLLATELEKDLDHKPTWRTGIEYTFHKKFCARTGFNIQPNAAFFGLGFKTSKFRIDYALQNSTLLNFGHQASVQYVFVK